MLLLLCAVTAWAQTTPTAGNWYHIKNVNAGFYMQSAIYNQNADGALQMGALSNSDAQKFYLEDAGNGKFYLKQTVALTDYYVLCNTMWNFTVTSGGDKTTYTINLVDNETDIYSIARDNGGCIGADATSNGASLYGDKGVGNNGKWQFEECDAPFVPTVCDFDPNKDYRIKSMSTGLYLQCDHPYWTGGEGAFIITDKNASDRQVFKFEKGAGENEYNITFTTDETKFYMNASGWNFYAGAEAAGNFTIALVDERGIYTIEQSYSSFKGFAGTNNGATAAGSKMYSNQGAGADNIRWTFEEVAADVFYDVVYNFSYNDSIFATASSQVLEGSAYPELEAPFGFTYEKPLGIVAHNDTVTVTCTAALPFEFAADTNSITKWYYLKLKGKYIQYLADDNTFIEWADDAVAEGEERSHLWAFVGDPINGFKLINNEAGKDMVVNNDRVLAANDSVSVWFAHKSTENTAGAFSLYNATQGQYMNAHYEGRVDYWSNDAGCMFLAEAAPDVTITYNLVYGADSVSLGTSEQAVCLGCDYPAVETPYGFAAAAPEGIALKDTTIVIACEDNLPFKYAASVEEIKNWYYVHYHSNKKDGGFINSSEGTVIWGETNNVDPENETAYMWGFVGDPINGFKVYNYATKTALTDGDEVVLGDGSVYTVKPTNETTEAAANGFTLWSNEKSTYVNAQGTILKYWGSADAGSTLVLTEIAMTSQRELELLIASIEAENIASSNFVGEATAASGAALAEAIATAKAITEATAEDVQALQAARDAIEYNELGEGTYMFINAKTEFEGNKAMSTYALDSWTGSHVYPAWTTINENDPLQYFTLEAADEENHYYIKTMTNEYISSATSLGDATAAEFISINGVQFKIDLGGILHANLHQYGLESSTLTTWNENANSPSAWKLMKVAAPSFSYTLNVSAAGYATLNLAFTANIPTDVTCYVAASKNDTEVKMTAIEGNVLPANTPVIVKANEGSYVFNSTTDNAPAIEDNLLLGTAYPKNYTDASYTYYVLAMVDGNVGLYPDAFEGDLFANGANKAYLKVEASQAATGFSFYFGGTTEVEDIKIAGENDTIYDVTGRKIDAITTPGLYIINGVKTIVK